MFEFGHSLENEAKLVLETQKCSFSKMLHSNVRFTFVFRAYICGDTSKLVIDLRRGGIGSSIEDGVYARGGGGRSGGGVLLMAEPLDIEAKRSPGERENFFRRAGGVGFGKCSFRTIA